MHPGSCQISLLPSWGQPTNINILNISLSISISLLIFSTNCSDILSLSIFYMHPGSCQISLPPSWGQTQYLPNSYRSKFSLGDNINMFNISLEKYSKKETDQKSYKARLHGGEKLSMVNIHRHHNKSRHS